MVARPPRPERPCTTILWTSPSFFFGTVRMILEAALVHHRAMTDMPSKKKFKLSASEIRQVAPGRGACIATDMITVDGHRVRFMYREPPDNEIDSGWRFMAGYESDEYMNDPDNHAVYDVNTIANYDSDIVPLLDAPCGSAFERPTGDTFVAVDFQPPED